MKNLAIAFVIALTILPCWPASRGACAETSATLNHLEAPDVVPLHEDPNDPTASPEERVQRQRALIGRRMKQRLDRLAEAEKAQLEAQLKTTASDAQTSSSTQSGPAEMLPSMNELKQEFESLRAGLNELIAKAGPAIEKAVAQPEPRSYRVEAEAKLINEQTLNLTGYGEDEIRFSVPLITPDPAGKSTLIGSFELSLNLKPLQDAGKVQVQYSLSMDVPVLKTYNAGGGNASVGQITLRSGMTGKVVLKAGEAKVIGKVGENAIRLTVTPE